MNALSPLAPAAEATRLWAEARAALTSFVENDIAAGFGGAR